MAIVIRRRGDDVPLLIGLTDSSGSPINITNLAELYVYVINTAQNSVLAKFSKAGIAGFDGLLAISAFSYRADILSGTTKTAALGMYHIDINVVETDGDYESNQKNTIGMDAIFNLKDSISKTVSSG